MAENNTQEADVKDAEVEQTEEEVANAEELAGFEAAMNGTALPESSEKKDETKEEEVAETVVDEKTEETKEEVKVEPEKVEPPLAKVTEEQFNKLVATATTVEELKAGLEKLRGDAFGKLGGIERLVKQFEKMTDSGLEIQLTDDDFAEVDTEVPMLTKPLQKLLTKIVKNAKVKVPAAQSVDIESLQTKFNETVDAKVKETASKLWQDFQTQLVTDRFPDWRQTVAKKEFHAWLAEQDKESPGYQDRFLTSWDAREIGGVLKKFNAHTEAEKAKTQTPPAKPPKKVVTQTNTRTQRLLEAIPAKANSTTPRPKGPISEEEAFELAAG